MILDASALVGLILREPRWERLLERIDQASRIGMGTPTLSEASIVLQHKGVSSHRVEGVVAAMGLDVIPFTWDHARIANVAYLRYGKGRHPASLNYGDCLSYAVAKMVDQPLLFLGNDFSQTDVTSALPEA